MASTMPISSPLPARNPHSSRLLSTLLLLATVCGTAASAQTLARPGWAGSGLTTTSWWRHAILYEIDPHHFQGTTPAPTGDLRGVTQRLDYLQSLGIDAILLQNIQPQAASNQQVIDTSLGTLDDLDDLLLQASHRSIRVLIDLHPASPTADLSAEARFWLSRGIAGFHLTSSSDSTTQLHQLRAIAKTYVGERVLIGDFTPSSDVSHTPDAPQLLLNPYLAPLTQLDATILRPTLEQSDSTIHATGSVPLVLTDDATHPRSFTRLASTPPNPEAAKVIATLLLTTRASSMLLYGQEIGLPSTPTATIPWGLPPNPAARNKPTPKPSEVVTQDADPQSLLNWYRQLSNLQHSNLTLRAGANLSLNLDDQHVLAWVRKPQNPSLITPPLVFLCNLSAQPTTVSLTSEMQRLHLRGSFLRSVLRSDTGMGAQNLGTITLAPFATYIGELRY